METSEFKDLPALPRIAIELETILPKLWSESKVFDRNFTVNNLFQAHQQEKYDSSRFPLFIQFSDRRLSLAQINELNLELPPVDLLVLSACETALGDKDCGFGNAGRSQICCPAKSSNESTTARSCD